MRKLMAWVKRGIRRWLGLGEMFMGVDVGFHDQSVIVIASRLKNGSLRILDARFDNMEEIERLVKELQHRYGIRDQDVLFDRPYGACGRIRRGR